MSSVQIKTRPDGKMELRLPSNNYNIEKIIVSKNDENDDNNSIDNSDEDNRQERGERDNKKYFRSYDNYDNDFFDKKYLFKPTKSIITTTTPSKKYPIVNNGYESYIEIPKIESVIPPKTTKLSESDLVNLLLIKEQYDKKKKSKSDKHNRSKRQHRKH
jgi:hypothetical protein